VLVWRSTPVQLSQASGSALLVSVPAYVLLVVVAVPLTERIGGAIALFMSAITGSAPARR
jgi:hypothetical protein